MRQGCGPLYVFHVKSQNKSFDYSTTVTDLLSPLRELMPFCVFKWTKDFQGSLIWTHIPFLIRFFKRKYYMRVKNSCHSPPHSSPLTLLLWPLLEESAARFTCQARAAAPPLCWHLELGQTHSWGRQTLEVKEKQSRPVRFLYNVRLCFVMQFGFLDWVWEVVHK